MMEPVVRLRVDLRTSPYESTAVGIRNGILEKKAYLSSTWKEFLVTKCGLKLPADGRRGYQIPLYVCSNQYVANPRSGTPTRSGYEMGWRASLEEKVGDFIAKYKRYKPIYSVRLLRGLERGGRGGCGPRSSAAAPVNLQTPPRLAKTPQNKKGHGGQIPSTSNYSPQGIREQGASSSGSSNARGDLMDIFLNDVTTSAKRRRRQGENLKPRKLEDSISEESDSSADDDAVCDGTAANDEQAELNAEGIQVENLIPRMKANVDRLDNTLFLKAKKEIKRLRASGLWSKHQKRAPFVSIVMDELLRVPPPQGE